MIKKRVISKFIIFSICTAILSCMKLKQNPMLLKVNEFESLKKQQIKKIEISPVNIGRDALTIIENITIQDDVVMREVIDLINFPIDSSFPENLLNSMLAGGCCLKITFSNEEEFYVFTLFKKKVDVCFFVEYKLSYGPDAESKNDYLLPDNYTLGHGYSVELHDILLNAINSAARKKGKKEIWTFSRQSPNNPMREIVDEFEAARINPVQYIEILPAKIGPDLYTLRERILIKNETITRQIIDLIDFPENPSLPENLRGSGDVSGCSLKIRFSNKKEFCVFVLFREGGRGRGTDYKLSRGPVVLSSSDKNLPGNYGLGHGFSDKLYDLLHEAIELNAKEKPIWIPSEWR